MSAMKRTMKPFIKLYRSPRNYYFFDVNRNRVCQVSWTVYEELQRILDENANIEPSANLQHLLDEGWLSSNRPKKIYNSMVEVVPYWLKHEVSHLILQVTQACNLCCVYCPYANNTDKKLSRHHTNKAMLLDTAKRAIDLVADRSDNCEKIFISFYGGEPLIGFPMIRKAVEYAEEQLDGKEIHFYITTNATLLTEEMIRFFEEKKFFITFSMDGPKIIHDKHRIRTDGSPTFDKVMNALRRTVDIYGKDQIGYLSINMVMNPENSLDEILEWMDDDFLKMITIRTDVVETKFLDKDFEDTTGFFEKFNYQKTLATLDYLQLVKNLNVKRMFSETGNRLAEGYAKMDEDMGGFGEISCPSGPCISGVKKVFVNVDGDMYPCEKVNELSDSMCIGNVYTDFDIQKISAQLNIAQLSAERCKNCWAQVNCTACQRDADDGDCLSAERKNRMCSTVIENLENEIYQNILMRECRTMYRMTARDNKYV